MAFTAPDYTTYYNQSNTKLNEYYARLLAEERGDVERAKRRLDEDYSRGSRINVEDYERNIAFGEETAEASKAEETARSGEETRALEGDLLRRGVQSGGLATGKVATLEDKQKLRREAIDRALRKSEEDLKYAKERGLEETTLTQKRGTEDVASEFAKFQTKQKQEQEEKALGLAEQTYQREFGKRQAEESFRLQEKAFA